MDIKSRPRSILKFNSSCLLSHFLLALLIALSLISTLIPPFQSPDEFDHIRRAYFLGQGKIILDVQSGHPSGGFIDAGLDNFMHGYSRYPFKSNSKLHIEDQNLLSQINWSGDNKFVGSPSTAYYMPLIYAPQAIGLYAGKFFELTISNSYFIARSFAIFFTLAILSISFRIYPPSVFILALLSLPMTLFQMSSASLDGISTALSILAISIYMRIIGEDIKINLRDFVILNACIFLVVTSRAHLFPLILLPIFTGLISRKIALILLSFANLFGVLFWYFIALKTTVFSVEQVEHSFYEVASFYFNQPLQLYSVFKQTFSNPRLQTFYYETFFGILGWQDAKLPASSYGILMVMITMIFYYSVSIKNANISFKARILLLSTSITAFFLPFLILLITWNPHPAKIIEGVQGRYFLVPLLIMGYVISSGNLKKNTLNASKALSVALLFSFFILSCGLTTKTLLNRYYLSMDAQNYPRIGNKVGGKIFGELTKDRVFTQSFQADGNYIIQFDLLLANFARANFGKLEIGILDDKGALVFKIEEEAKNIKDNEWLKINTGKLLVNSGQNYFLFIRSLDGTPGNAITWWASFKNEYDFGEAIVDHRPESVDFVFEVVFAR